MTKKYDLSSAGLHILAMFFMLCDHLWGTILPWEWLTCVGRLAFPIFAFMIVEGYYHTHNLRQYILRLLILAIVSEIPFNLLYVGTFFYPFHQNVIWTFLIGLLLICLIERSKKSGRKWIVCLVSFAAIVIGFLAGFVVISDYYGTGVLTVLVFYFFRGRKWWNFLGQLICLYIINFEMLGGLYYPIVLFGHEFELLRQGLAILVLIPIWLYRGRQGYHTKAFQYFCYAFYPVHMLLIVLVWKSLLRL